MYKRVDQADEESVEGFSYENRDGGIEVVKMNNSIFVNIADAEGEEIHVYYEDIPNLIKALKSAYDLNQGK